jgi:hypothetical protein
MIYSMGSVEDGCWETWQNTKWEGNGDCSGGIIIEIVGKKGEEGKTVVWKH